MDNVDDVDDVDDVGDVGDVDDVDDVDDVGDVGDVGDKIFCTRYFVVVLWAKPFAGAFGKKDKASKLGHNTTQPSYGGNKVVAGLRTHSRPCKLKISSDTNTAACST